MREIQDLLDSVKAKRPELSANLTLISAQAPSDVDTASPVVQMLERALHKSGLPAPIEGLSAWTDAALLNEAGIAAVCFGPGDIAVAHAAEEYVPVSEIRHATAVLTDVAREWMMEKD
jgi:acetylornithine deacetylase